MGEDNIGKDGGQKDTEEEVGSMVEKKSVDTWKKDRSRNRRAQ